MVKMKQLQVCLFSLTSGVKQGSVCVCVGGVWWGWTCLFILTGAAGAEQQPTAVKRHSLQKQNCDEMTPASLQQEQHTHTHTHAAVICSLEC